MPAHTAVVCRRRDHDIVPHSHRHTSAGAQVCFCFMMILNLTPVCSLEWPASVRVHVSPAASHEIRSCFGQFVHHS